MTLKTKRVIFNINSIICLFILSLLLFYTIKNESLQVDTTYVLVSISILSFITTVFLQLFYKKSLSTQIVFISVFITTLSLQSIRIIEPIIDFNSFLITIQLSRISIFCKYICLLSLLGTSLFSYSIKKQKVGSWLSLSIIASLIISTFIHFNTGIIDNNLVAKVIYGKEEITLSVLIALMIVITFIKTGFDTKNREYIHLGTACLLLYMGLELSYLSLSIISGIFIIIFLTSGFTIYLKSVHNITLWG